MSAENGSAVIGVVVVAHFGIAQEYQRVVEAILRAPAPHMRAVSVSHEDDPDAIMRKVSTAVKEVDRGRGVLILTDMFGGTPSNVSLSLLEEGKVEVVSGFNLPMLLKVATCREAKPIGELAAFLRKYGADHIHVASHLLAERKE